jgi:hypothetical protein
MSVFFVVIARPPSSLIHQRGYLFDDSYHEGDSTESNKCEPRLPQQQYFANVFFAEEEFN